MTTGAVWPSSLCHCRHKGACPLAAGSPNGCMVEEENKHRDSETGQNQAVSAGLQRSKTLNKSSAASAWHCSWPGKGGWGKRRAGLLLLLPTAVKQAAHPQNISENDRGRKKKLAGMGNFPRERATVITLAVRILSLAGSHQLCFIFYVLTYKEPWPAFPCIVLGPPDRLEIAYHIE